MVAERVKGSAAAAKKAGGDPIEISIRDVGGVHEAKLVLRPGVNELGGKNGSGKTSSINAIRRAHGERVPLEPRDGAAQGVIEAPGVVVKIKRRVTETGDALCELADTGPVARAIDPGLKGSEEAAIARIRAVIEMLCPAFDAGVLEQLAADPAIAAEVLQEYREGAFVSLSEAAERVRLIAHRHARAAEATAAAAAGKRAAAETTAAAALERAGGDAALVDLSVAEAEAAETRAREAFGAARAARERRLALERQQEQIRATLGTPPDPSRYDQDLDARESALAAADQAIRELERKAAQLREQMAGIRADRDRLREMREREVERARAHQRQLAVLEQAVEGPTEAEVGELEMAAMAAQERRRAAAVSSEVRALRAAADQARAEHETAAARAEQLRDRAKSVYDRLSELPGIGERTKRLRIVAGRLHVVDDAGELHDFELRRSEGQRIDAILDVALEVFGPGSIVPIDGRWYAALDAEHRQRLAEAASQRGLYLLTEQATAGGLHVRHLPAEAAASTAAAEARA